MTSHRANCRIMLGGVLDVVARDVEVGAGAEHLRAEGRDEHARGAEPGGELGGGAERGVDGDPDEVRLDRARFEATGPSVSSTARARIWALAWSSASRSTWCSSACRAAAAMMPACRIPPPSTLRSRWASRISVGRAGEGRADRRAQALGEADRDRVEVPGPLASPAMPEATTAFISRAPSRCMARPCARAQAGSRPRRRAGGRGRRRGCACSPGRPGGSGRSGRRRAGSCRRSVGRA